MDGFHDVQNEDGRVDGRESRRRRERRREEAAACEGALRVLMGRGYK